ncbi:two-component system response regulator YesN [Salirhabdus euzebyi]|uniref:Two-component system response regulator YesN n=1 Tax=Salirhabdus euzebyi TaxID=394506 RepID=A0A841Q5B6_9BACI|nr:response regulator [Salirhabdus euzebyi]MBB6453659.1 two-component system response regulator YesN [Salirhabdus euzebyi]
MIKILIVDDEQIERDGLQVILERNFSNLKIKQAKNGKLAVDIAASFQPDLVFMDIQMPGMSGFEAVEKIIADNPHIKFIMVTAYATFDYAHLAMKLGVKDYLVKPSKVSDIVKTVGKVLGQIEAEQRLLEKSKFQQDTLKKAMSVFETDVVTQLLFDHVHEVHLDELVELLNMEASEEKFVMSILLPLGSDDHYSIIKEKIRKIGSGWVGALYGRQLPIIVFRNQDQTFRTQATLLAKEILTLVKTTDNENWFIGIGNVYKSLNKIRQSYQESLIATKDTKLPVKYRFYSDLPATVPGFDEHTSRQYEQQFFEQIRSGEWEQIYKNITDLIDHYEQEGANLLQVQQRLAELLWIASRVMSEMGVESDTHYYSSKATDYRQLRAETKHLLERIQEAFYDYNDKLEADTIQKIKQYIIQHAHEDISLDAIGKEVGFSPIYISKIFKEQLGVNYIHFLTECRIEEAKKLMKDPEKSLKEITFEVGYHDPNYFSKVFKKMCNLSPSEYRKKLLG